MGAGEHCGGWPGAARLPHPDGRIAVSPPAASVRSQGSITSYRVHILIDECSQVSMVRNITWTISNLCRGKKPFPDFNVLKEAVPMMYHLLHSDDEPIVLDCAWGISYLTDGEDEKIQFIVDHGFVPRLVQLLSHPNQDMHIPTIRAIGNIVTGTDSQTQAVIDSGALNAFRALLASSRENIRKEAAWFAPKMKLEFQK